MLAFLLNGTDDDCIRFAFNAQAHWRQWSVAELPSSAAPCYRVIDACFVARSAKTMAMKVIQAL